MTSSSPLHAFRLRFAAKLRGECAPVRAKGEDWRYTSLKGFDWDRTPHVIPSPAPLDHPAAKLGAGEEALLIIDPARGMAALKLRDPNAWNSSGAKLTGILDALESGELQEKNLEDLPPGFESDPFTCWVSERFQDGAYLHVPKGKAIPGVIRILYVFREETDVSFSRSVLRMGEEAQASVIEEWISIPGARAGVKEPLFASLTSVHAGARANLSLTPLAALPPGVHHYVRHSVETGRNASVQIQQVSCGGAKGQHRWESVCRGEGSEIAMKIAVRSEGSEHFDFWIRTNHPAERTRSGLDAWAIVGGRSRIIFNGNLIIPQSGKGTDAYQRSRNLLLSEEATVDSVPKLEIACDDVKVAHGASVSPVSPEQLYYLRSRGIPADEAEAMIVDGFAEPVIAAIPSEEARARARAAMGRAIGRRSLHA